MTSSDAVTVAVHEVETPQGPGRLVAATGAEPYAVLLLGHGAGGGIDARDLDALAERLPAQGIQVVRYEQPWRTAGRKVAVAPPKLDEAWRPAVARVREWSDLPLFLGGRSAGARVACRTASELGAAGVVCLSFPLHPPGRPERSRAPELLGAGVPTLVLQGEKDPFGRPAEVAAVDEDPAGPGTTNQPAGETDLRLVPVPGADHGLKVPARSGFTAADVADLVVAQVAGFVAATLGRAPFGTDGGE